MVRECSKCSQINVVLVYPGNIERKRSPDAMVWRARDNSGQNFCYHLDANNILPPKPGSARQTTAAEHANETAIMERVAPRLAWRIFY